MREYVASLVKGITSLSKLEELQLWSLMLHVDWEELPGETKRGKTFALIITLASEGRLADLITLLHKERPKVQWPDPPPPDQQINFGKGINLEGSTAFVSFSQGIDIMGEIGDEVFDYATDSQTVGTEHRRIVEALEGVIVNRSHGQIETITPEQFEEKLGPDDLEHIHTLAEAMENHYQQWRTIYPKRGRYSRPAQNKKVQQQLDELVKEVAQELGRIVRYLDRLGFSLDDHYQRYRDLADQLN
jgi:hypothetical protein